MAREPERGKIPKRAAAALAWLLAHPAERLPIEIRCGEQWDEHIGQVNDAPPAERETAVYAGVSSLGLSRQEVQLALAQADPADLTREEAPDHSTFGDLDRVLGSLQFAWRPWLPCGMLSVLGAEPKTGKGLVVMHFVGVFTRPDWTWLDGTSYTGRRGPVLWLETEAGHFMNRDRARAWGLPLGLIHMPFRDPLTRVNLDYDEHRTIIERRLTSGEYVYAVLDSFSGSSTKTDENRNQASERLRWLADVVLKAQIPCTVTPHTRKRGLAEDPWRRITLADYRGHSSITQYGRSYLGLDAPDPVARPGLRRLYMVATNLGPHPERGSGLEIGDRGLEILSQMPEKPEGRTRPTLPSQSERARALLENLLSHGPRPVGQIRSGTPLLLPASGARAPWVRSRRHPQGSAHGGRLACRRPAVAPDGEAVLGEAHRPSRMGSRRRSSARPVAARPLVARWLGGSFLPQEGAGTSRRDDPGRSAGTQPTPRRLCFVASARGQIGLRGSGDRHALARG